MEAARHHTSKDKSNQSQRPSKWQTNDLAAAFAVAVSVPADACVARRGKESIYAAFCEIFSEACLRPGESTKHRTKGKISEAAFNKVLQAVCGFKRVRTRRKRLASAASNWLFFNRRWLSPENIDDAKVLSENYEGLCSKFTDFRICAKIQFMQVLRKVSKSWANWKVSEKHAHQDPPEEYELYANEIAHRIQTLEVPAKILLRRNFANYTGVPKTSELFKFQAPSRYDRLKSTFSEEQPLTRSSLNAGQLVDDALDRMLQDQMVLSATPEELSVEC